MTDIIEAIIADTLAREIDEAYRPLAPAIITALQEHGFVVVKTHPQYGLFRGIGFTPSDNVEFTDNICFNSAEEREAWEKTPDGIAWLERRDAARLAASPGSGKEKD